MDPKLLAKLDALLCFAGLGSRFKIPLTGKRAIMDPTDWN